MKYLITQSILLVLSVAILYYFSTLPYFLPVNSENIPNWYNVFAVLAVVFVAIQAFVSLFVFLLEKFMTCGKKEFPNFSRSLRWGIGIALGFFVLVLLNVFHVLSIQWGLVVGLVIIVAIVVIK